MNWKARIVHGKNLTEVNPVWAFFDKRGYTRIQFIIIPILFLVFAFLNWRVESYYGLGLLTGVLFLNTMVDAMTLNKYKMFEGTKIGNSSGKSETKKKALRKSFLLSFFEIIAIWFIVPIIGTYFSVLIFLSTRYFALSLIWIGWSIGDLYIGIKFFNIDFKKILDLYLFRKGFSIPKDDGIPRKTKG